MTQGISSVLFPTTDMNATKAVFSALVGADPDQDSEWYVGFQVGDLQLGLVPDGMNAGMEGPTSYWEVSDIDAAVTELSSAGAQVVAPVNEPGGGVKTAMMADGDGNRFGIIQQPGS